MRKVIEIKSFAADGVMLKATTDAAEAMATRYLESKAKDELVYTYSVDHMHTQLSSGDNFTEFVITLCIEWHYYDSMEDKRRWEDNEDGA